MADRPEHKRDVVNKIFGDALLPKSAEDAENSPSDDSDHDRWLRENTPPHHQ
jgi:hypothetical protein